MKKIYILVACSDDGRIVDLGWSTSLNVIREAINSNEVKEQLNELTINTCEFKIRDNYYLTNYYGLEQNMNSIIRFEEQRRKKKANQNKCPLCGMTYSGRGNNPYPFQVENCCNNCNAKFVIPMRMFLNNKTPKYAVVFDTNGNIRPVKPKGDKFTLEELQSLVGGLIEVYPRRFNNRLVICNEEGLIRRLKKNEIFKKYSLKSLVGDIVLCPPNLFD